MDALTTTAVPTLTGELLRRTDSGTALTDGSRTVTYQQLPALIEQQLDALDLPVRSLVVLSAPNSIDAVIAYLALLHGGHVPLLASDDVDVA